MQKLVRRRVFVVILCIVVVVGALLIEAQRSQYNVSLTVLINNLSEQETSDYRFGGFYELQAAEQFATTVQFFFVSPENVRFIFEDAGVALPGDSLRHLSSFFQAEAVSPQQVEVRYRLSSSEEAGRLAEGIRAMTHDRVRRLNELNESVDQFAVTVLDPVVLRRPPQYWWRIGIGAVVGGALSYFVNIALDAWRRHRVGMSNANRD